MDRTQLRNRRRSRATPQAECLESRSLMTGGAGNTFALIPGTIATSGANSTVPITIEQGHFTLPHRSISLGVDIVPQTGSTLNPMISGVSDGSGHMVRQAYRSIYNPHFASSTIGKAAGTQAVIAPLRLPRHHANMPVNYHVTVAAMNHTSGGYLLGFYLPGDANGDGVVTKQDLKEIRASMGTVAGTKGYNFDADSNRDGVVGGKDLALARRNLGEKVTILPLLTSNLDPASDSGVADRVTTMQNVNFSGVASPGATISYAEINSKSPTVTTVADAKGDYKVTMQLALGSNTFKLTAADAFGQTISGRISPVIYTPAAPPTT